MLSLTRDTKRLTFIVIYVFIFLGLALWGYLSWRPDPTCFDGKENQNETGVDCGGVCATACMEAATGEPIAVRSVTAVPTAEGRYDVVAEIVNPNNTVGAKSFNYAIRLLDAGGEVVASETGRSWVLPREAKVLLAFNLAPSTSPDKAILEITDVSWARLADYDTEPKVGIYSADYVLSNEPGEQGGVASGLVVNESDYDFRLITIKVILRDAAGNPLAVNQTDRRTFIVGDQHAFRLPWPTPFGGQVAEMQVEIDADVYNSDNFLKRFLPASPAQSTPALPRTR